LRAGIVTLTEALHYATNAGNLQLLLSDFNESQVAPAGPEVLRKPQIEQIEVEA
jgi:hypothetical protein